MKYWTFITFVLLASCSKEPPEPQLTLKCEFPNYEVYNLEIENFLSKDNFQESDDNINYYFHSKFPNNLAAYAVHDPYKEKKCRNDPCDRKEAIENRKETFYYKIYMGYYGRDEFVWEGQEPWIIQKNTLQAEKVTGRMTKWGVKEEAYRVKGSCSII
jgi:hypothetical protein